MAHDGAAVRLDDGREGSSVEVAARYPAWELVVPHAVVTTEEHVVLLGDGRDGITIREGKGSARWLGCVLSVV